MFQKPSRQSHSKLLRIRGLPLVVPLFRKELFVERRHYDAVVSRVARVVVVNPHRSKVISASVNKSDRWDAEQLALYPDKGLLVGVRMKDKPQRELQHMLETLDLLVKQRSALKAEINNLLAA